MVQIRINLGCGQTPTTDWQNFDNSKSIFLARHPALTKTLRLLGILDNSNLKFINFSRAHSIKFADVTKRLPFPDGTVDVVYSSHMLEHLDRDEAVSFLREAKRVLRPRGVLRLAVPDIRKLVDQYIVEGDADAFIASTHMCQPRPRTIIQYAKLLISGARHHNWMYDGQSLRRLLERVGFVDVEVLPRGQTTIENPGKLDLQERWTESIYVESVKPI